MHGGYDYGEHQAQLSGAHIPKFEASYSVQYILVIVAPDYFARQTNEIPADRRGEWGVE